MNLIANTGIQLFTIPLEINLNDNFKMYFYESFNMRDEQLNLEIAHKFTEDDVWVKKRDLSLLGYLTDGKIGSLENGNFKAYKWDDIKNDFFNEGNSLITPMGSEGEEEDCFQVTLNRCRWEKLENQWLPLPYFTVGINGRSEFGPTNWCRAKLIPEQSTGQVKKYSLLLAFDTRSKYEGEDFEEEDLNEMPVFASSYDRSKSFTLCNDEFSLIDYCSKVRDCEWVDEHLLNLFYNVRSIDKAPVKKPKMSYLAQYVFLIRYIQQCNVLPEIKLFSDKNVEFGYVDLVVDMGNSRTCAVLFDNSDFTRVEHLSLQNFSNPVDGGKLNRYSNVFDMRLVFREADFGGSMIRNSMQFVFPSMVRLGEEADELIHRMINLNTGVEKISTFSSPKRYLWDNKPQQKEWEFASLIGEQSRSLWIKGVSEQLNADGSLNINGGGGVVQYYSRKALMTLCFVEILAQANMQINSYDFRHRWGNESTPRKIGRIIVTCPTAMSRVEQIALRKCAQDAAVIVKRFYAGDYYGRMGGQDVYQEIQVIPLVKKLLNTEERTEWIYDEATAAQFVYLFAEISKRYNNRFGEYFDFYGKVRNDLGDYRRKSLTIGSVDIGSGTTDVMIAAYKYDNPEQCVLTPVPLFWESFYIAGDDLLKDLIRKLVIEGPNAAVHKQLENTGRDISRLLYDFFGHDNARLSVSDRQIRSEFNLQVSMPVVLRFLELQHDNKIDRATLSFDDIFAGKSKPTERVMDHFQNHFGFSVDSLRWQFDRDVITKIIEQTFDALVAKISTILSYYGCDIVLLSGRPTSLKALSDLFLKYYAVSPNRLITLSDYRIGTWYPFHDGKGFFKDAKSIVAVGAMIGNFTASRGGIDGFSLDLSQLIGSMTPTTDYFATSEHEKAFMTPVVNSTIVRVSQLPLRIWTRQLDAISYPSRPFYVLEFDYERIKEQMKNRRGLQEEEKQRIKDAVDTELDRLRRLMPFTCRIVRESYLQDKETLKIESVEDRNHEDLPVSYFSLQVKSLAENESYWLETGEFTNIGTNHN